MSYGDLVIPTKPLQANLGVVTNVLWIISKRCFEYWQSSRIVENHQSGNRPHASPQALGASKGEVLVRELMPVGLIDSLEHMPQPPHDLAGITIACTLENEPNRGPELSQP